MRAGVETDMDSPTYLDRFGDAFINEMHAFVDCCLDNTREFSPLILTTTSLFLVHERTKYTLDRVQTEIGTGAETDEYSGTYVRE